MRRPISSAFLLGLLLACPAARAQVAAYEGFAYPAGRDLDFQDGGSGFVGPWSGGPFDVELRGSAVIMPGSLAAGALGTAGNRVAVTGFGQAPASFGRFLAEPLGAPGTTAWLGFVIDGSGPGNGGGVILGGTTTDPDAPPLGGLGVGDPLDGETFGLARVLPGSTGPAGRSRVPVGGRALLVVRMRFAAGADTFDLFVNPTPGGAAPATPDASVRFEIGQNVDRVELFSWAGHGLDELRLGDSFAAVAPAGGVPPAPASPASLRVEPSRVAGGASARGTVTLSGPAPPGGQAVALSSSRPAAASVPATVSVPAGATVASFPVATARVAADTAATISASSGGATRSATLTVTAPPARTPDAVSVRKAEYDASKKELRVEATSSRGGASLRAHVAATGQLIGTLRDEGGGRHKGRFSWPANPRDITVRSSLGGSATARVEAKR